MGIDVWRLRGRVATDAGGRSSGTLDAVVRASEAKVGTAPDSRPSEPGPAAASEAAAGDTSSPVAPFTVLCLVRDQAQVLIEPTDLRAGRRFAADLLASATGVWGGESRALLFEWPHAGIENRSRAMTRALTAFIQRQLDEPERSLTLIGAEVIERLDLPPPGDLIVLPQIDELMRSSELKRALWVELAGRNTS
jgi:hypothetical protein